MPKKENSCEWGLRYRAISILMLPVPVIKELIAIAPTSATNGLPGLRRHSERTDIEFSTIPNAGHCVHDEKPEMVNELIVNWLKKVKK